MSGQTTADEQPSTTITLTWGSANILRNRQEYAIKSPATARETPLMTISMKDRWIGLVLILLVLTAFGGVVKNDFVGYDDQLYVTQNDHVQAGLTKEGLIRAFTTQAAANWHPLTMISHMFDCQMYGVHPVGHHLTSLFFHIANTLLLFLLLLETTGRRWESAVVAALFGIHPLHVESVAWISERKDVLSGFFGILALLSYVRYARKPHPLRYTATLFLFALGLLSKPMLVTLPIVFLLLDFWPLKRIEAPDQYSDWMRFQNLRLHRSVVMEKIPFFSLSLFSGIVTMIVQAKAGAMATLSGIPLSARILNAAVSYQGYMEKTFWPDSLAIFYPYVSFPLLSPRVIGAGVFLLLVSLAAFLLVRRHPYVLFGWLWFLITLLPVIGIVQVGLQSMADRYMYLPSIGVFIAIVWSVSAFSDAPRQWMLATAVTASILIILSVVTWRQVEYWRNTKTLFQHATEVTAKNWLAHRILGDVLLVEGNLAAAEREILKSLAIWPGYSSVHASLANLLEKKGAPLEEVLVHFNDALLRDRKNSYAYIGKGDLLVKMGETKRAIAAYSAAEMLTDDNSWKHNILGVAYAGVGLLNRALAHFHRALVLSPKRADTNNNIGRVLNLLDRPRDAIQFLVAAIALQPDFVAAYNNAGIAMQKTADWEKAAYYFSAALMLNPGYEKARENLRQTVSLVAAGRNTEQKKRGIHHKKTGHRHNY